MHSRPKKIQRVVLLDEEDAQPVQDIHDDPPDEWKEAKVYYPSRDDRESIELSYSDIKCLDPESYLSSPIMNFYIRYLQIPISPIGSRRSEYHFFNTYFYKKLEEAMSFKVPQQKNEYDCGVFVLYFMERFIEEAPERLRKNDLAMFCSKWFKPEDASGLRKRIRDLLLEEFENARLENDQESSSENDAMEIDEH